MYTVFVNDKPFRLVDANEAEEWKGNSETIFIAEKEMNVLEAVQEMEEDRSHPGFTYLTSSPGVAWQLFISYCTLIEASGGLVMNEKNEYLIIFRKGKYDLPKGKMDYDETPEQCGSREVKEECGIDEVEIIKPLDKSFHTYMQDKKRMLKKTNWYLMKAPDQKLVPQAEEDIHKAEWMTKEEIKSIALKNTYASIEALLRNSLNI
jgi:ADP-ribose pyrophosphatase YjhB (NUDIX family)